MYDKDQSQAQLLYMISLQKKTYIFTQELTISLIYHKDNIVDAAIGINDSLYLKKKRTNLQLI